MSKRIVVTLTAAEALAVQHAFIATLTSTDDQEQLAYFDTRQGIMAARRAWAKVRDRG